MTSRQRQTRKSNPRRGPVRSQPAPPPRAPPPIPFLLLLIHLRLPLLLHRTHSLPLHPSSSLRTTPSLSFLTAMRLSSRRISPILQIQRPHSSGSAATFIANNSTLKRCLSFTRAMHQLPRSTNLSTSSISLAPHAASSSCNAHSYRLHLVASESHSITDS